MKSNHGAEFSLQSLSRARCVKLEQFSLSVQTSQLTGAMHKEPANAAIISGIVHFELRQYDRAQGMFSLAFSSLPQTDENYSSLAALHVFMAHAIWRDQDLTLAYRSQRARIHYEQAFSFWEEKQERELLIEHMTLLVTMCLLAEHLDSAVNYGWRALRHAERAAKDDLNNLISCYCQLAACLILSDQVSSADKILQAGIDKSNLRKPDQPYRLEYGVFTRETCELYSLMSIVCTKKAQRYRILAAEYLSQSGC